MCIRKSHFFHILHSFIMPKLFIPYYNFWPSVSDLEVWPTYEKLLTLAINIASEWKEVGLLIFHTCMYIPCDKTFHLVQMHHRFLLSDLDLEVWPYFSKILSWAVAFELFIVTIYIWLLLESYVVFLLCTFTALVHFVHLLLLWLVGRLGIVTPTDHPKSVRNHCVMEVFGGVFVLSRCALDLSVGVGAFVIWLSLISSFFI